MRDLGTSSRLGAAAQTRRSRDALEEAEEAIVQQALRASVDNSADSAPAPVDPAAAEC